MAMFKVVTIRKRIVISLSLFRFGRILFRFNEWDCIKENAFVMSFNTEGRANKNIIFSFVRYAGRIIIDDLKMFAVIGKHSTIVNNALMLNTKNVVNICSIWQGSKGRNCISGRNSKLLIKEADVRS